MSKKHFAILDEDVSFWKIFENIFNDAGIHIEIINPVESTPLVSKLILKDLVIVQHSLNDNSLTKDLLESYWSEANIPYSQRIPLVELDNRPDLANLKLRWKSLNKVVNLIGVLPIFAKPTDYLKLVPEPSNSRKTNRPCPYIELIPLPTRFVSNDGKLLDSNAHWSWPESYPKVSPGEQELEDFRLESKDDDAIYSLRESAIENGYLQIAVKQNDTKRRTMEAEIHRQFIYFSQLRFQRMRFFRILEVPDGENDIAELIGCLPDVENEPRQVEQKIRAVTKSMLREKNDIPYTSVRERYGKKNLRVQLDDRMQKLLSNFLLELRELKKQDNTVVYKKISPNLQGESSSVEFMIRYLDLEYRESLFIPILSQNRKRISGLIVLDTNTDKLEDAALANFGRPTETILEYIENLRLLIHEDEILSISKVLDRASEFSAEWHSQPIHGKKYKDIEEVEKAYVESFLKQLIAISGYDLASLAWRRFKGSRPVVRGIELRGKQYSKPEVIRLSAAVGEVASQEDLPALFQAMESGKPKFFHRGLEKGRFERGTNKRYPRLAFPIFFEGECYGAVGLSVRTSKSNEFRFLQHDFDRVVKFAQLGASGIYYLEKIISDNASRYGRDHDILSSLNAARMWLSNLQLQGNDENLQRISWYLDEMEPSAGDVKFSDDCCEYDPCQVAEIEIDRASFIAKDHNVQFFKALSQQEILVKGRVSVFQFSLRTILSNAIKFSPPYSHNQKRTVSIEAEVVNGHYVISVENYGKISEIDLQNAFEFAWVRNGEREETGAHIALAIAKERLKEDFGEIGLENDNSKRQNRVRATITLPLGR
ncbi:MAG: ATP-binding protein [Rhodobacteraceae bacterium]|nr:ATP-binding protein [Paracoccaceae bacterium]